MGPNITVHSTQNGPPCTGLGCLPIKQDFATAWQHDLPVDCPYVLAGSGALCTPADPAIGIRISAEEGPSKLQAAEDLKKPGSTAGSLGASISA